MDEFKIVANFKYFPGNIALARSYMAGATMENERNTAMSLLASMQALGFILGPGLYVCVCVCHVRVYVCVCACVHHITIINNKVFRHHLSDPYYYRMILDHKMV